MMQVDLEKCTGCGECLDTCSVEAISLIGGKAAIDVDTCLSCGVCAQACPAGAISEVRLPAPARVVAIQPVKPRTIQPIEPQIVHPVPVARPASRLAWARPALSFIGREIVPRLADTLIAALDRRLSASQLDETIYNQGKAPQIRLGQPGGMQSRLRPRQARRRRRGRKF